jgi:hypothetical protein
MAITNPRASTGYQRFATENASVPTAVAALRTAGVERCPQLAYLMSNIVVRGLTFALVVVVMKALKNAGARLDSVRELISQRLINSETSNRLSPMWFLRVLGWLQGRPALAAATEHEFRSDSAIPRYPRDAQL